MGTDFSVPQGWGVAAAEDGGRVSELGGAIDDKGSCSCDSPDDRNSPPDIEGERERRIRDRRVFR